MARPDGGDTADPDTGADRTCPSARCAPGATLLGVKGSDGRVHNLRTAMPIDEAFVQQAKAHGAPEQRMRFAAKCETSGCSQWTGDRCGVIDRVLGHLEAHKVPLRDDLPPCPIRGTCRWYSQTGRTACHACDLVVTDNSQIAAE
ncbi:hypothetical protein [Yoonia sp. BS5-3]|uniref:Uncharacterized protein n=1 Tax=Yoonia phaeophyticola TaxID=3137369 RepID=A0ABZ2V8D2_9RHOB